MSGIYGVWQPFGRVEQENAEINKLRSWNQAYGAQYASARVDDTCFLGCFVEKLNESAPQSAPVLVSNGCYTVLDVVLYNREELLAKGSFAETLSDEELLLQFIETFGYPQLQEVNGDFAGVVYDVRKKQVTFFRDHMGVRPLFYYFNGQELAFSTDIRGLISMQSTDTAVAEKWLWSMLTGGAYTGTENTEFAHIFCVKPASYMTVSLKNDQLQLCKETYWQIGRKKIRLSSEEAYKARLRELITDSIQRRLNAVSGLVAGELSGGLDSSIIDILIHRLGREAVYFSWSASPEEIPYAENDERLIVKDICEQEQITCHYSEKSVRIGEDSVMYQKVRAVGMEPEMNAGLYRRYVLPPYISTLQIAKVAQYANNHGAKVVFTGHGGDETVSHRCNPYELFYHGEYLSYLKLMWESTQKEKHRVYRTVRKCAKNLLITRKKLRSPFASVFSSKDMLKKEFLEKFNSKKGAPNTFAYDTVSYIRNGGSRNRLDIVALLGAYGGARYIAPYLDYRVADYAVSIPRHLYLKHQRNRYIFKETFKDIIPESLYNLTGKEDTSWRNVEKKEKDPVEYLERKKRLLGMLDREYWDAYLDWDALQRWADEPLGQNEESYDFAMLGGIDNCLSLQNLVTFSRKIEPERNCSEEQN